MEKNKNSRLTYKIISTLLVMLFLLTAYGPTTIIWGAASEKQDRLDIVLIKGKAGFTANGITLAAPAPYMSENILYIPMRAVLEAMGADVEAGASGTVTVTFRDIAAEIKVGSKEVFLNQAKNILPAPPALSGNTVMVPLEFLKLCFGVSTLYDSKNGKAIITLEDDGALSDLSFLTGSITAPRAGNSYFGWSISLPKGSRAAVQSFNSKYVQFENEHYGIAIEIEVKQNNGKTLQEYYDQIAEDPYPVFKTESADSTISSGTTPRYIEVLYTDLYDEAVYERIYAQENHFIHVLVTSYEEADPEFLKGNKAVRTMLDSFSLLYKGNRSDTIDFSKVNFGLARYSNYITSEATGKKYLSWEMEVLPEWDLLAENMTAFNTQFNGTPGEYIRVELNMDKDNAGIEAIGKDMISLYTKNFNPEYYTLKSSGVKQAAGYQFFDMQFEVKFGSKRYGYNERLVLLNGIVYDITFRVPLNAYEKEKDRFNKMFDTFKPSVKDSEKILADLQKDVFNSGKNRVGKADTAVAYENKVYKWKLRLPGYWQKNSTPGQSLESFYDKKAGAVVMVEASPLKEGDAEKPDQERFFSMSLSDQMEDEPVKTYTERYKNKNVTVYKYRIDDSENETYADVNFHIFDEGGYRYCFMSTIPDLTSSEFNLNSLEAIWNSFEITK